MSRAVEFILVSGSAQGHSRAQAGPDMWAAMLRVNFEVMCVKYESNGQHKIVLAKGSGLPYINTSPTRAKRLRVSRWAFSSGGERFPDTEEVTSSNLVTPTIEIPSQKAYAFWLFLLLSEKVSARVSTARGNMCRASKPTGNGQVIGLPPLEPGPAVPRTGRPRALLARPLFRLRAYDCLVSSSVSNVGASMESAYCTFSKRSRMNSSS